jgi:regulator of RNase E activity RraB
MNEWKIKKHSYQIADTGNISITNGKICLCCDCDVENEELKPIIDALNNSKIEFEIDDSTKEFEISLKPKEQNE